MIDLNTLNPFKRQPGSSLLALAFDGSRLDGLLVRRTNGSVEIRKSFVGNRTLDLLTDEPELAGREIRNLLDAEQIHERWCAVCLPLNWAITLTIPVPGIPEEDVDSFLQIEAERGFPYPPEELMLATSRFASANGESFATLVGIPHEQVGRLESVLQAAQLRPVTFSLGLPALSPAASETTEGVVALLPGDSGVGMQITCGGGLAVLRTLDGVFEQIGPERELQVDQIARELRITLGQLRPGLREGIKTLRILGRGHAADAMAAGLRKTADSLGLKSEQVHDHPVEEHGIKIPLRTAIAPGLSLAVRQLAGIAGMEFLPPKVSRWKQFTDRYSSGKLAYTGMAAGAVALVVACAFLVQGVVLWHWKSKWSGMEKEVVELAAMRDQIRRYRPWYDQSVPTLSILKQLTRVFPEDGAVSAKTVELRQPATVTCSGTARSRDALIKTLDRLREVRNVSDVHIETTRGSSPLEFTFNFQWGGPGTP